MPSWEQQQTNTRGPGVTQGSNASSIALPFINLADSRYGLLSGGSFDNSTAINAALADAAAYPNGARIIAPAGLFLTTGNHTIPTKVTLEGNGSRATIFQCSNATGGFLLNANYSQLEKCSVLFTANGAYGVKIGNDTVNPSTGVFGYVVRDVKAYSLNASCGNAFLVRNAQRGILSNCESPRGSSTLAAMQVESCIAVYIERPKISTNDGEDSGSGSAWHTGIHLTLQTGNVTQQTDSCTLVQPIVEGCLTYGVRISGLLGSTPPARNVIINATLQGNVGGADLYLENCHSLCVFGGHHESATTITIAGNDGNHNNCFDGVTGKVTIANPPTAQGIQTTKFFNHNGDITINGANVFGTEIFGCNGVITDTGSQTTYFQSTLANTPNAVTAQKIAGKFLTSPAASSATIQGSGGSFQTVTALPANTCGKATVWAQENGSTNIAIYEVMFVHATGKGILVTPVNVATAGATTGQLTFQLSGSNLQAKGANAVAPSLVRFILEYWQTI